MLTLRPTRLVHPSLVVLTIQMILLSNQRTFIRIVEPCFDPCLDCPLRCKLRNAGSGVLRKEINEYCFRNRFFILDEKMLEPYFRHTDIYKGGWSMSGDDLKNVDVHRCCNEEAVNILNNYEAESDQDFNFWFPTSDLRPQRSTVEEPVDEDWKHAFDLAFASHVRKLVFYVDRRYSQIRNRPVVPWQLYGINHSLTGDMRQLIWLRRMFPNLREFAFFESSAHYYSLVNFYDEFDEGTLQPSKWLTEREVRFIWNDAVKLTPLASPWYDFMAYCKLESKYQIKKMQHQAAINFVTKRRKHLQKKNKVLDGRYDEALGRLERAKESLRRSADRTHIHLEDDIERDAQLFRDKLQSQLEDAFFGGWGGSLFNDPDTGNNPPFSGGPSVKTYPTAEGFMNMINRRQWSRRRNYLVHGLRSSEGTKSLQSAGLQNGGSCTAADPGDVPSAAQRSINFDDIS
ncbi:hypothetical protein BT63DRAFT_450739 [Microthyrium microscopicum]|uniref:Uncharacterized protein n=1 Tax=Microthyrium microscopicum TaxID=703497 RepID=A0A6A6UMN5_9PEZI|nr:hypothetical protein BT63DRAFT_450739 [Microthyrium microscopicum]